MNYSIGHTRDMDTKEIKSAISNLERSLDDATVLKLLNILNDGVVPTEKLLRDTKVGVAVNKFRSHGNAAITSLVKKMIRDWRDAVQAEKNKRKSVLTETAADTKSPVKQQVKGSTESKFHNGPRNPKTDGVNTAIYDNTTRNASISALYTALAIEQDDPASRISRVATDIELEVFKSENLNVSDSYRNRLRTLTMNLRNRKNPELRERVVGGAIAAKAFITMTPSEMAPDALKQEIEKLKKQNLFDAQGATEKRAVTDRFTCGKCKHKKVSYYQMQTRSADEPLTTFCTCENCGNRWKFS